MRGRAPGESRLAPRTPPGEVTLSIAVLIGYHRESFGSAEGRQREPQGGEASR